MRSIRSEVEPDDQAGRMPARLADGPRDGGLLGRGSPVRYYLPAAPLTGGATVATVLDLAGRWNARG